MLRFLGLVMLLGTTAAAIACASSGEDTTPEGGAGTGGEGGGGGAAGAPAGGGGEGGAGVSGGEGGSGGVPLGCPADGPVLALDQLDLGDMAWQSLGEDLDGQTTTTDFTTHCLPNSGANPNTVFFDGPGGRDNSWGKNVLPAILPLIPTIPQQVNDAIDGGEYTLMFFFEGLAGSDADPLTTKIYGGAPFGMTPAWNGADCWSVLQEELESPTDIDTPKVRFDQSSVSGDIWQSGGTDTLVLHISIAGYRAALTIHVARMQMQLNPTHTGAAMGRISGVIDTEELVAAVHDAAGAINAAFCTQPTITDLLTEIRQASDIMLDGTQDPLQTCNAVSIGLGFTATAVGIDGIAPPQPLPPDFCP